MAKGLSQHHCLGHRPSRPNQLNLPGLPVQQEHRLERHHHVSCLSSGCNTGRGLGSLCLGLLVPSFGTTVGHFALGACCDHDELLSGMNRISRVDG